MSVQCAKFVERHQRPASRELSVYGQDDERAATTVLTCYPVPGSLNPERGLDVDGDRAHSGRPTRDIAAGAAWYERLFGRPPDNRPMDGLVEWQLTDNGWLQVTEDADRAGTALLNLAVDDIKAHMGGVRSRGFDPGEVQTVTKGVQLSAIDDPDGNTITFIGGFRVEY